MSSNNEVMTMEEAASVLLSMRTSATRAYVPTIDLDADEDILQMMPPRKMAKIDTQCQPSGSLDFSGTIKVYADSQTAASNQYVPMSLFEKLVKKLNEVMGQKRETEVLKNKLNMLLRQNFNKKDIKGEAKDCNGEVAHEEILHDEDVKDEIEEEDPQEENYTDSSSEAEANDDDCRKVPIGSGRTTVPANVLKSIDWSSYTIATRTLLQTLFTRRTLATHSLTGKKSPAFADKPAKKRLDPNIVGDIVQIVTDRCGVPARLVRGCITTKCADETKMMRNSL